MGGGACLHQPESFLVSPRVPLKSLSSLAPTSQVLGSPRDDTSPSPDFSTAFRWAESPRILPVILRFPITAWRSWPGALALRAQGGGCALTPSL